MAPPIDHFVGEGGEQRRAVDALLLEAGDDLRPAGAVCDQSMYEDDILGLQRCRGAWQLD
jgi:hypothetical protein